MWDMRRNLSPDAAAAPRCTIQFLYPEVRSPASRTGGWWSNGEDVDLCGVDPGFEVDLLGDQLAAQHDRGLDGRCRVKREIDAGHIELTGDKAIARSMQQWLGLSPFAKEKPRVA